MKSEIKPIAKHAARSKSVLEGGYTNCGSGRVRAFLSALVFVGALVAGSTAQASDPVKTWNEIVLDTIRAKSLTDAQAAYLLAMVNIAMYDAANGVLLQQGISYRNYAIAPPINVPASANVEAATVSARTPC